MAFFSFFLKDKTPRKFWGFLFALFFFSTLLFSKPITQVAIKSHAFQVELANTPEECALGLMYRTELPLNQGMLFVFNKEAVIPFWMKNTPLCLDMLWINAHHKIVYIEHKATPLSEDTINPGKPAMYVLEINGGLAEKYHLHEGDTVRFN